jgi:glycosyltransferase involved in cell wall biosynthesis
VQSIPIQDRQMEHIMEENRDAKEAITPVSVIRIAYDLPPLPGGSSRHAAELSERICRRVNRQIIIAPHYEYLTDESDLHKSGSVMRVRCATWVDSAFRPRLVGRLIVMTLFSIHAARKARHYAENPNESFVLHVHGVLLAGMIVFLCKMTGIHLPMVATQHTANPRRIGGLDLVLHMVGLVICRMRKNFILCVLDDGSGLNDYQRVLRNLGMNWRPIHNAIDTESFKPALTRNPARGFKVLSNSRLHPYKRIDLAILAFVKFLDGTQDKAATLTICGSGNKERDLRKMVSRYPDDMRARIQFIGQQETRQLVSIMQQSDVVVGTSLVSNLSRAILEAMACEKPVIVFDCGEISKLIDNMNDGIVVKDGDLDGFADRLRLLQSDSELRDAIGKNARLRIIREYSWDNRIESELDVYKSLIR